MCADTAYSPQITLPPLTVSAVSQLNSVVLLCWKKVWSCHESQPKEDKESKRVRPNDKRHKRADMRVLLENCRALTPLI